MVPLRILIIDDEVVDRLILRQYLEQDQATSYVFAEASTGADGLKSVAEFHPDCILLDFNLPDVDGLSMIRSLSTGDGALSCAVVMLTALGSETMAVEAMKLGLMDYVIKGPASSEALPRTVASAVQRFRLQQALDQERVALARRNAELEAIRHQLFREKERYRRLSEAIPQYVWSAGSDGIVEDTNLRLREFTGRDESERWALSSIVHPDDCEAFEQHWKTAVQKKEGFEAEIRLRTPSGNDCRRHLVRALPTSGEDDEVHWFGTFTDIEEQKRAEEALRERQKVDSIGLLAGGIAHDFNNLLVGILGGASLALDLLEPTHPACSTLDLVLRASVRAAELIQQLLAYAGKGHTFIEPVDVTQLVRDTCELAQASAPKTIRFVVFADPHLPLIETNTAHLQQLVMNLVINAFEAIGDQAGLVRVDTRMKLLDSGSDLANQLGERLPEGEYLLIEVEDTGRGMDEATIARIFDPFFTTKFTGRGLGLAAVQGIVRTMGGAVTVQSEVGKGSTFRLLLPATRVKKEAAVEKREERVREQSLVLVIDDEEVVRRTTRLILERAGYSVISASGGEEGLALIQERRAEIGLVLLDMNMPKMSGNEVLIRIREFSTEIPVAIVSGFTAEEVSSRLDGLGADGFIRKPFTGRLLIESVQQILVNSQGERDPRRARA